MSYIDSAWLADLRALVLETLPETCNIVSPTNSADSAGGITVTWGTVTGGTAVSCMAHIKSEVMVETAGGKLIKPYSAELVLPYDAPVQPSYRIEYNGATYKIVQLGDTGTYNIRRKATIERVP